MLNHWGFDYDVGMKLAVFVIATVLSTIVGFVVTDVHHFFEPTIHKKTQDKNHESLNSASVMNCLNNIANPECIKLLNH
jgi:fatty acid desaturase